MDASAEKQKKQIIDSSVEAAELAEIKLYQTLTAMISDGKDLLPTQLKEWNRLHKKYSGGDEDDAVIDNFDAAAEHCGVSKRTINVWLTKGWITQKPDGTFDRDVLDQCLVDRGRKNGDSAISEIEMKMKRADLRFRLNRARLQELAYKQMKGNVIVRSEVVKQWRGRVIEVTSGLEILADRLPPLLAGRNQNEMHDIIRDEVDRLRNAYARDGRYCPKDGDD